MHPRHPMTFAAVLALVAGAPLHAGAPLVSVESAQLGGGPDALGTGLGAAVDIEGDLLAIGEPRASVGGVVAGAVRLYHRTGNAWTLEQRITPPRALPLAGFGSAVALDGDRLYVGAPAEGGAGAVDVFRKSGDAWLLEQTMPGAPGSFLGTRLAASQGVIAIAAPGENSVYVIDADARTLVNIVTSPGGLLSNFGADIAIDAGLLVVGEPDADRSGLVHLYDIAAGAAPLATIEPPAGLEGARFGAQVATANGRVIASSQQGWLDDRGAVFVIERVADARSGTFQLTAEIAPPLIAGDESFAADVAIDGDRIIVGSPARSQRDGAPGAAYVFALAAAGDRVWTPERSLAPSDTGPLARFGSVVAAGGGATFVGAAAADFEAPGGVALSAVLMGSGNLTGYALGDWSRQHAGEPVSHITPFDVRTMGYVDGVAGSALRAAPDGADAARGVVPPDDARRGSYTASSEVSLEVQRGQEPPSIVESSGHTSGRATLGGALATDIDGAITAQSPPWINAASGAGLANINGPFDVASDEHASSGEANIESAGASSFMGGARVETDEGTQDPDDLGLSAIADGSSLTSGSLIDHAALRSLIAEASLAGGGTAAINLNPHVRPAGEWSWFDTNHVVSGNISGSAQAQPSGEPLLMELIAQGPSANEGSTITDYQFTPPTIVRGRDGAWSFSGRSTLLAYTDLQSSANPGETRSLSLTAALDFSGHGSDCLHADDRGVVYVFALSPPLCSGDADGDGAVRFIDLTSVLANFGNVYAPGTGAGDADADGVVRFIDVTSVLANFGTECP